MSIRIPKYRLHKGSGQAFVQIKGLRRYLGKQGPKESWERYQRVIAEICVGPFMPAVPSSPHHFPGDRMALVELLARCWHFAEGCYV